MSHHEENIQPDQPDDENIRPARFIAIDENTLKVLIERSTVLENEIRTLKCKTDQILKIARKSVQNQEV